jgi:hypothetical protein
VAFSDVETGAAIWAVVGCTFESTTVALGAGRCTRSIAPSAIDPRAAPRAALRAICIALAFATVLATPNEP